MRILIVGTGDLAHGLAHMYQIHHQVGEFSVEATEPIVTDASVDSVGKDLHDTGVKLVSFDDDSTFSLADIIILAIPSSTLHTFVKANFDRLRNSIVVDVSNPLPNELDLSGVLEKHGLRDDIVGIRWVKAFNDNGAIDLLTQKSTRKTKVPTKMCGPDLDAVKVVKRFAEDGLGFDVVVVPFSRWGDMARQQASLGSEWVHSAAILLAIFIITEIYAIVRYNVKKGYAWGHLPLQVTNKAICWTAIYGFALTQLPGTATKLENAIKKDTLRELSRFNKWALSIRKQLGVLSLYFLVVHVFMSLLIFNPKYYGKFFLEPSAPASKLTTKAEISFLFGILGFSFYLILGVCTLPSVGLAMTKRQFQVMYGKLVWTALAFGTIHVMVMGVSGWSKQETWPGGMPPITLLSVIVPLFSMSLKFVQVSFELLINIKKLVNRKRSAKIENDQSAPNQGV